MNYSFDVLFAGCNGPFDERSHGAGDSASPFNGAECRYRGSDIGRDSCRARLPSRALEKQWTVCCFGAAPAARSWELICRQ